MTRYPDYKSLDLSTSPSARDASYLVAVLLDMSDFKMNNVFIDWLLFFISSSSLSSDIDRYLPVPTCLNLTISSMEMFPPLNCFTRWISQQLLVNCKRLGSYSMYTLSLISSFSFLTYSSLMIAYSKMASYLRNCFSVSVSPALEIPPFSRSTFWLLFILRS
jgi:hypothetical protein